MTSLKSIIAAVQPEIELCLELLQLPIVCFPIVVASCKKSRRVGWLAFGLLVKICKSKTAVVCLAYVTRLVLVARACALHFFSAKLMLGHDHGHAYGQWVHQN